eukprot:symbB.v1.2.002523.t1/scaffold134.1/size305535/7
MKRSKLISFSLFPLFRNLGSLSHGPARSPCVEGASLVTPKLLRTTTHSASRRILTTHDRHPWDLHNRRSLHDLVEDPQETHAILLAA